MAEEEARYFEICSRLQVVPDASFLIAMRTKSPELRFSRRVTEADLLAICDFLVPPGGHKAPDVFVPRSWDLSGTLIGSNGAALVARMLRAGLMIESASLANSGIGPRGFRVFAEAIESGVTGTLRSLDLADNVCHHEMAARLARAVESGPHSIEFLDVSCSHLSFPGVFELSRATAALNKRREESRLPHLVVSNHGNLDFEEIANSITHGIGLLLAIAGAVALLWKHRGLDALHFGSGLVFVTSLILVYASSFLYHSLFKVLVAKRLFHRFDRLSIYLLIAGTYSPFSLLSMNGRIGWLLFTVVWTIGIIGIGLDLFAFGKFQRLKLALYLSMGWACVIVVIPYITHPGMVLTGPPLYWLAAGGFWYTSGVVFFVLDDSNPAWHILWHVFVMLGSLCHWISINYYIMSSQLPNPPVDKFIY